MKKVLGLVGATMLFAGPALAADLAVKAPALAGPLPAQWSGFYLGIHGGYGWGRDSVDSVDGPFSEFTNIAPFSNPSPKGGVFGGQAGYNWQYGSVVTGLEIDVSSADLKDSRSNTVPLGNEERVPVSLTSTLSSKIDLFGSARARAGFLLMPDWLLYGTAGLAWAHDSISASFTETVGTRSESISSTAFNNHFGWAAGAGVEYRLWQNLLLRAEYLHYGFGSSTYSLFGGELSINSKLSIDVVRGGLSYKF
jgi:opacity protein-like surface antigen